MDFLKLEVYLRDSTIYSWAIMAGRLGDYVREIYPEVQSLAHNYERALQVVFTKAMQACNAERRRRGG